MRITCVGGGPAGLYFSLLMKLRDPRHDVVLLERNATGATHGWGVTLERAVLDVLRGNDPASAQALERASVRWTRQAVRIGGQRSVEGGYSMHSIGRQTLVDILAGRARDAGVRISYGHEATGPAELPPSDLIVAADGVRSRLRSSVGGFGTDVREGRNRYMWLGSSAPFEEFNYIFVPTDHGWVWAYAYQFCAQASTVIVECSPATWAGLGFEAMSADESVALLSDLFKDHLGGHKLTARLPDGTTTRWLSFPTVTNKRWHAGNVVLAGDSAHTAHYSLGQGMTMALNDAIALAGSLALQADVETALTAYETRRKAELVRTLSAARRSSEWFEDLPRYINMKPHQFALVLHARWSPLVAILPPRLTYRLRQATRRSAVSREMDLDQTVRVIVTRPDELGPAEISAWRCMQQATPSLANPFLSPEFTAAVSRLRLGARVAVLTEGQSITGFFPFEKRRHGMGVPVCGWLTPCQGVIHEPGMEWDPRALLRGCRLSAWRFDNLIAEQRPFQPFHAATVASPIIDISDGYDAYYARLRAKSPRFCRELERKTRKLERELGELRVEADSRDASVLRALMAWKSDQYRQTSHVDRFEQPWLVELLDTLLATRTPHVTGVLSVLYAGDQPVAAQFGLRTGGLLVGWFTGYEACLGKYSPGLIHLMAMTEELAKDGIRVIDMGAGAKKYYKETLKSGDTFVAQGIVTSRSVLGTAHRVRSALTWSARRTVRRQPGLHHAADQILRRSGVAARIYGRI